MELYSLLLSLSLLKGEERLVEQLDFFQTIIPANTQFRLIKTKYLYRSYTTVENQTILVQEEPLCRYFNYPLSLSITSCLDHVNLVNGLGPYHTIVYSHHTQDMVS